MIGHGFSVFFLGFFQRRPLRSSCCAMGQHQRYNRLPNVASRHWRCRLVGTTRPATAAGRKMSNEGFFALLPVVAAHGVRISAPIAPPSTDRLFNDRAFQSLPRSGWGAVDIFAVSHGVKEYLHTELAWQVDAAKGVQQGFFEALYNTSQLQLEYESVLTRTAAAGLRCALGELPVARDHGVGLCEGGRPAGSLPAESMSRTPGAAAATSYFSIGHVNIGVGKAAIEGGFGHNDGNTMTIDFLPPRELRGVRSERSSVRKRSLQCT